ncbi:MAG: septum site-determining protein MinD [Clostridia bacterium]|nr:septum site-determining protein MinD [Clostridia bacterium]
MARKIVITSGKGGVGKTTICANLGNNLANNGYKVVVMDLDIGLNNLDVVLGVESKVVFDVFDVLHNRCRARQALIQDSQNPYLFIMPSNHTNMKLSKSDIKKVVGELDEFFDYILIDCPAGIEDGFHRAVSVADEAIVVVTPHISSLRDADKVVTILFSLGISNVYGIVNRVRGDLVVDKEMLSVEDVYELLQIRIVGAVPEDDTISTISSVGGAISTRCGANRAFDLLCENLIEGSSKIYDCTMSYRGFMGLIKRKLKKKI